MKTFEQFKIELNEIRALRTLSRVMRAGPAVKNLKTPFKNSVRMYHGTTAKNAANIMKRGFKPTQTVNPKNFSTELSNVFQTTNPNKAQYYANLMAKIRKDKPSILAVDVKKSNIRKGVKGDEFIVPVSNTRPVATDVKPIKRRRGEVIQDNYQLNQELNERVNLKPIIKGASNFFKKKPPRSIDPFFANKAVERGTMVRGFHGQSSKNIARYKKTGVTPTVSGLNPSMSGYGKATQDWMKRTGYKPPTKMARPGIDAYFATATETGKRQATKYRRRGARYENEKLKNQLNPFKKKDKGEVMDVVVNKRSIRKGWKRLKDEGTATERIAKAQDIIPVVPGPSSKIAKYRLMKLKRTKHQSINSQ